MADEQTITNGGSSPSATSAPETARGPVFAYAPEPKSTEQSTAVKPAPDGDGISGKEKDLEGRFDKDPAFQKRLGELREKERKAEETIKQIESLRTSHDTTIKQLMEKINGLEGKLTPKQEQELGFEPIHKMSPDQFRDKFDQDPIDMMSNVMRQIMHELGPKLPKYDEEAIFKSVVKRFTDMGRKADSEKSKESARKTITDFAAKHEDFEGMVPEIQKFISENPGHNAISAYHELKGTTADVDSAIAKAKTEWEKEHLKDGIKSTASTIKPGAGVTRSSPTEIKRKSGETENAYIYRRAMSRMKAA